MVNHPNRKRALPPLASALKAYRDHAGLTQRAAAEAFGIPLTSWRDMEQPGASPDTHLANVAGAIISELLGETTP